LRSKSSSDLLFGTLGGHTNTERGYLPLLANRLLEEVPQDGLEVLVSEEDKHPLQLV
jgi:putative NIF3 family GTP cyclohydrolase 1 type 2